METIGKSYLTSPEVDMDWGQAKSTDKTLDAVTNMSLSWAVWGKQAYFQLIIHCIVNDLLLVWGLMSIKPTMIAHVKDIVWANYDNSPWISRQEMTCDMKSTAPISFWEELSICSYFTCLGRCRPFQGNNTKAKDNQRIWCR